MSEELKINKCIKCNSEDVEVKVVGENDMGHPHYAVQCKKCEFQGVSCNIKKSAILFWNGVESYGGYTYKELFWTLIKECPDAQKLTGVKWSEQGDYPVTMSVNTFLFEDWKKEHAFIDNQRIL